VINHIAARRFINNSSTIDGAVAIVAFTTVVWRTLLIHIDQDQDDVLFVFFFSGNCFVT
jgi:hypothetical protein